MPRLGCDRCFRGLVFFCQAIAAARNPNAGRIAMDDIRRADRRVAGHDCQPVGFRGGRVDGFSQIVRRRTRLRRLTVEIPRGLSESIPRWPPLRTGNGLAYNTVNGRSARF